MSTVLKAVAVIALLTAAGLMADDYPMSGYSFSDRMPGYSHSEPPEDRAFRRKATLVCICISAVAGLLAWWLP